MAMRIVIISQTNSEYHIVYITDDSKMVKCNDSGKTNITERGLII